MSIKITQKGSFDKTRQYLTSATKIINYDKLEQIAKEAVEKFKKASPSDDIARGWSHEIVQRKKGITLFFNNSENQNGVNIALIVDSGHASRSGQWVSGKNYLKEPTQEAYNKILKETWEELKAL